MDKHFDVIVIGVGSMGSAACWQLARSNARVLGLDQFLPPHTHGAHAGQTRIIRKAYFEHPDYVPLLDRSYQLWTELEDEAKTKLFYRTGIAYFGPPAHPTLEGVQSSSERYGIPLERISHRESALRFSPISVPENFKSLYEPDAGFVLPEGTIKACINEAIRHGATLRTEQAISWESSAGGVKVRTGNNVYAAEKLVIAAGAWTSKLLPDLATKLRVTEQHLAWIMPTASHKLALDTFPCWFIEDDEMGMFYGFPFLDGTAFGQPSGLKLANHKAGPATDPDQRPAADYALTEKLIRRFLSRYFPSMRYTIAHQRSCLYTYSPDENFVIDFLPGQHDRVVVACGFSGHGFKFVPVVGEALSDLALTGKTELPIGFLNIKRFL